MNHRVKLRTSALICSFLIMPAFSQSNEDTPEIVFQSYLAAMQAGDWAKCASLIHPDSLGRVRNIANRFVDSLLAVDKFGGNLREFFGVSTKGEFEKLSDDVVFQRALQRMSLRPGITEIIKAATYRVLGTVKERDDLVHVLYKADVRLFDSAGNRLKVVKFERHGMIIGVVSEIRLPDADNDRAEVISVKKHGPAWRLLSGDEVETELNEWQKSVDELQETMSKLGDALSKKSVKASSRKKTKRTTPR